MNCVHGKAAELSLANSYNNSIATTKYIEYGRVFDKIFSLDQIGSSQAKGEPLYF